MKSPDTVFSAPPRAHKLLGLEVIRFLAAFSILLWHYQHFAYGQSATRDQQPFYSVLSLFYEHGADAVSVFWCISGYIFFYKYRDVIAAKLIGGRKFFVLRFSRLYPLHIVTLLLVAVLQLIYYEHFDYFFVYQGNNLRNFLLHIFLAQEWGLKYGEGYNEPTWSVSVEILAYAVFFLGLRYVSKSAFVNIAVVGACTAAIWFDKAGLIIECFEYFYIGGLAAIVAKSDRLEPFRLPINIVAWCAVCVIPVAILLFDLYSVRHFDFWFLTFYPPLLIYCAGQEIKVGAAAERIIQALGNMTYSSYLIHIPIQIITAIVFMELKMRMPFESPAFLFAFLIIVLTGAHFVYEYFEAPAQNAIRRISAGYRPVQPAETGPVRSNGLG